MYIFCTSLLAEIVLRSREVRWWLNYAQCFLKFFSVFLFSLCSLVIYSYCRKCVHQCHVCLCQCRRLCCLHRPSVSGFTFQQLIVCLFFSIISTTLNNKLVRVTFSIFLFVSHLKHVLNHFNLIGATSPRDTWRRTAGAINDTWNKQRQLLIGWNKSLTGILLLERALMTRDEGRSSAS